MTKAIAVIALIFACLGTARPQTLVDGERLDGIVIGQSTISDVIARYGADYKLKKWSDYSNALVYKKLGLVFYSCQADPKQEIFSIIMQAPFEVTTQKGIVLGKSTFNDLFAAYGLWNETSSAFEYERTGLYFNHVPTVFSGFEKNNRDFEQVRDNAVSAAKPAPESTAVTNDVNSDTSDDNIQERLVANYNVANREEDEDTDEISDDEGLRRIVAEHGDKIVRQIHLIEKGRLRQCHTDFR